MAFKTAVEQTLEKFQFLTDTSKMVLHLCQNYGFSRILGNLLFFGWHVFFGSLMFVLFLLLASVQRMLL